MIKTVIFSVLIVTLNLAGCAFFPGWLTSTLNNNNIKDGTYNIITNFDIVNSIDPEAMAFNNGFIYILDHGSGQMKKFNTNTGHVEFENNFQGYPGLVFYTNTSPVLIDCAVTFTNKDFAYIRSLNRPDKLTCIYMVDGTETNFPVTLSGLNTNMDHYIEMAWHKESFFMLHYNKSWIHQFGMIGNKIKEYNTPDGRQYEGFVFTPTNVYLLKMGVPVVIERTVLDYESGSSQPFTVTGAVTLSSDLPGMTAMAYDGVYFWFCESHVDGTNSRLYKMTLDFGN